MFHGWHAAPHVEFWQVSRRQTCWVTVGGPGPEPEDTWKARGKEKGGGHGPVGGAVEASPSALVRKVFCFSNLGMPGFRSTEASPFRPQEGNISRTNKETCNTIPAVWLLNF